MASSPAFSSTPAVGAALLGTRDTSAVGTIETAPSNVSTLLTGGSSGTKIEEIVVIGTNTTVAGVVNLFLYDGSTYHQIDQILISAVTASTTAVSFRTNRQYANLFLKDNTWSLRANHMAGSGSNDSVLKVLVFGGNF